MINGKGWLVLGTVVLIEAAFLGALLLVSKGDKKTEAAIGEVKKDTVDYISAYNVTIENFNQSVMTSGSQTVTLSMSLLVQLGRTPKEIQEDIKPSAVDMGKFKDAVAALVPDVRNNLVEMVNKMNYALLTKYDGKRMIANSVKDFLNRKLETLDLQLESKVELDPHRVIDVKITQFFLQ